MKRLSIIAFAIVTFAIVADFINGFCCTRLPWLLIGPVDVLYLPAFGLVALATALSAGSWVWNRLRKVPARLTGTKWQVATWGLLAVIYFTNLDPRLSGLELRAQIQEQTLITFAAKYRAGGLPAVASDPVMTWSHDFRPRVRATPDFVEVSWGATLPRTWGFRICDQPHPQPQFQPLIDAAAACATARLTVFIGEY